MGKLYSLISALLLAVGVAHAVVPDSYEWWFDHDVSSAKSGTLSGSAIDLQIDTSDLPKGVHYFNLRLAEGDSIYGPVYRRMFHSLGRGDGAISYEYWFDSDYDAKQAGSLNGGSNHLDLDISSLPQGIHYFNIRVGYGDGSWGPAYRKMVLSFPDNIDAVAYEYWIDDKYNARTEGALAPGENSYDVDLKGVRRGLHRFNYRLMSSDGIWGVPFISYFYSESDEACFADYEYWFDNDYDNRVTGNSTGNITGFEVDLTAFGKICGAHYFNLRTRDWDGNWSPVYRKLIFLNDRDKGVPVIGYRHLLDDIDLGYVELERETADNYMFDVNLPDSLMPTVRNLKPVFDGDRVAIAGADSVVYTIHVQTELGWSPPSRWKLGISNDFSTTAVEMAVNSRHEFEVPSYLGFTAVRFTSAGDPLYFRADVPFTLDIYRNGERVAQVAPEDLNGLAKVDLPAGDYYGLLYADQSLEAETFTLHLMDTPNSVPMPVITFEEGLVSITCTRQDATVRYTLDGSDPDEGSPLYSEPFSMTRNGTVKARAWVEGSDIEASPVAEFTVDTYKAAAPVAEFDLANRLLTLTSGTKDAVIRYTFEYDPSDSIGGVWTDYVDPIQIRKNCTVYSRAVFDGYNDSDITVTEITSLPDSVPTPEIRFTDGKVEITCANPDAEIHYTVDDPDLTAESPLYTEPFSLDRNATVRVFAIIPGLDIEPSDIVTYVVDSFKVEAPTGSFDVAARLLTLTCETDNAGIFYTFDPEGDWTEYTGPIAITRNRTVYVKASRDGWNDSDVAEIRITELSDNVPAPEVSFEGNMVVITCVNPDAEIHYTVDDPDLTAESPLYTEPFSLDRNATIRAFALIPGLDIEPSDIVTYVVDSYKVATPYGRFDAESRLLTMECDTEGASILYSFDREGEWQPYTAPISVEVNTTVYAKATRDGWNDSDVAEIVTSDMKCAGVAISYNGRYVRLETDEPDASIRYTVDGTAPTGGLEYTGDFDVKGLCTVRAVVVRVGHTDSDITEFAIEYYADEEHAETSAEGLLASAFNWDDSGLPDRIESFRVVGRLNDADYGFIRSMRRLRHLDLENVVDTYIPEGAFSNSGLVSVSLPADLSAWGDGMFSGSPLLSSVVWNSRTMDIGSGVTQGISNPNMLLYVPSETRVVDPSGLIIVRDGEVASVTLRDGYPYYAAKDFHAGRISLTKEFLQPTEVGECQGWETLVLPFSPDMITHSVNGAATPFASWDGDIDSHKPFWLYSSHAGGWNKASSIEAGMPYIISMPNSIDYIEKAILAGKVTFSATDVDILSGHSRPESTPWMDGTLLEGTFMPVEEEGLLSLNVGSTAGGLRPGSAFVSDGETKPFEAYVRGATAKMMPLFGGTDGVDTPILAGDGLTVETPAPGVLRVSSMRECSVAVTTVTGVTVRTLHLKPGEEATIEGLTRDLYIVAGRKVMVR